MKISYWLPKNINKQNAVDFINKEISEAGNIKSKNTKKNTISALQKIKSRIELFGNGFCYYSDGDVLYMKDYNGDIKHYNCSKDYTTPSEAKPFS